MNVIGMINTRYLRAKWSHVKPKVILTDERIMHIKEGHASDYERYASFLKETIEHPSYILEDSKNENTAMFIRHILDDEKSIDVVVKLAFETDGSDMESSVITMYCLGKKTLKRLVKKYPLVYRRE